MTKTVSTWVPETEQGTHVFRILGYSGIGIHKHITSGSFSVNASFELRLVNQSKGASVSVHKQERRTLNPNENWQCQINQNLLKASTTSDDCLTIECILTVYNRPKATQTKSLPRIQVPQSNMAEHFGKLMETKEGVDVTFIVGEVTFTAHKIVLATRSPVFKAELFGPMRKEGTVAVTIKDMQPAVFRALLHFIYTDSLPSLDDLKGDDRCEMIRHLLVAADRYAIERLGLLCQSYLCDDLQVHNVATTLALAYQHGCGLLKDACVEFIACSNAMEAVVKTEGYKNLKRSCPSVVIEALEKTSKARIA
ncbi:hypothetical protein EJB05_09077, partial [Eragrostis curvula]